MTRSRGPTGRRRRRVDVRGFEVPVVREIPPAAEEAAADEDSDPHPEPRERDDP